MSDQSLSAAMQSTPQSVLTCQRHSDLCTERREARSLRHHRPQPVFSTLAIVDVGRGHIPSIDASLLIEQRIVSDQEPAVFAVLTQHTLLIFERYGACERLPALLAQPFDILRVKKTSAIVLFLGIIQGDPEEI